MTIPDQYPGLHYQHHELRDDELAIRVVVVIAPLCLLLNVAMLVWP